MVVSVTGCDEQVAIDAMEQASGDVKLAVLLASGASIDVAIAALDMHEGNLRLALTEIA